jgi:hypothetical protein
MNRYEQHQLQEAQSIIERAQEGFPVGHQEIKWAEELIASLVKSRQDPTMPPPSFPL